MSKRTAELVSEWDSVPFDGLRTLADREFSGAVVAGSSQLFMLNGTVVGILDGDLAAFEDASGTARQAPHDALPLLVVMQACGNEPRAQYYTEETPIEKVDRTLTDGNFTGFVELSENVLSGDYYLVYHQGRSMSVAWVGSAERLITDDEAFDQANDEVGIYDVIPAEIELIDLPEPDRGAGDGGAGTASDSTGGASDATESVTDINDIGDSPGTVTESDGSSDTAGASPGAEESTERVGDMTFPGAGPADEESSGAEASGSTTVPDSSGDPSATDTPSDRGSTPSGPPGSKATGASQGTAVDGRQSVSERNEPDPADQRTEPDTEPTVREASGAEPSGQPRETGTDAASQVPSTQADTASQSGQSTGEPRERTQPDSPAEVASEQTTTTPSTPEVTAADLETRSIPSLDPELSQSTPEGAPQSEQFPAATESESTQTETPDREPAPATGTPNQGVPTAEVEAKLDEREATISRLESELAELSADNDALAAERDRLAAELEEARAEIQRLERQLQERAATTPDGARLSVAEAIDGTNLFVRYRSKGEGTLEQAQDGSVDRATVEENLRLEYHTQFDGANATVDGTPFEEFLQESIHYRFANWLVSELLYEIRDTGHAGELSVLYDALPRVDRAELNGNVSVTYTEDGKEHREQQQFDVVVRDRMGNPLVLANINDSRQPATQEQMTDIIRDAERVGTTSDSLAAAFLVTSSFFEPEALETAEEATSSGLFSRDKHKSFVNLSRKGGYHLCLLEARNDEFHLAVPEL